MASQPASVILPTVEPTPVLEELGDQLGEGDELLVVPDAADDPVAEAPATERDGVRVVPAGEPEGCSGKANAIATGMEAADNDLYVWTDDDFHHPPDWLASMKADYEREGPVTECPFFEGRDPLSVLLEPVYSFVAPFGIHYTGAAWGGAVIVGRDDLAPDAETFLADLRRSMSDDGLLDDRVDLTAVKRVHTVGIGGSVRETLERHVRWIKISARHGPAGPISMVLSSLVVTGLALVFPFVAAILSTVGIGTLYAYYGIRRGTFLLAYPAGLLYFPLLCYALVRRTFIWGGRRYHWPARFDVRIVDSEAERV